ncbi:MAG: preprotein translocase subunit SecG [Spirochaetes bacterium]|nr:preprotein translocase subunit SecG [Spirochaetota bacterium]
MGVLTSVVSVIFSIVCVLLIIIILLQADKGAGMGILGGAGQSTFGSSTADIITKITTFFVALFLIGSMGLSALESKRVASLKEKIFSTNNEPSELIENEPQPAEDKK